MSIPIQCARGGTGEPTDCVTPNTMDMVEPQSRENFSNSELIWKWLIRILKVLIFELVKSVFSLIDLWIVAAQKPKENSANTPEVAKYLVFEYSGHFSQGEPSTNRP